MIDINEIKARSTSNAVIFALNNCGLSEAELIKRNALVISLLTSDNLKNYNVEQVSFISGYNDMNTSEKIKALEEYRALIIKDLMIVAQYKLIYNTKTFTEAINEIKKLPDEIGDIEELPENYTPKIEIKEIINKDYEVDEKEYAAFREKNKINTINFFENKK